MTSQINLEEIYTELNNLLKDVCSFLTTQTQNGALSPKAKNEAEKLVFRSKNQVQAISKLIVVQESSNSNYPYLQMSGPNFVTETLAEYVDADINYIEPEYEESFIETETLNKPSVTPVLITNELCPYIDLNRNLLVEKSIKYGLLMRKERYFIIESKRQYMVGLVGYWLLIYTTNKKELKPIETINLTDYVAQVVENKKDPTFEIYSENQKSFEFIARTPKDLDQWIVAINCKKKININCRNLPEIPDNSSMSDNISDNNRNNIKNNTEEIEILDDSDCEIYASPEELKLAELSNVKQDKSPILPPRQPKHFSVLPKRSSVTNATYNNVETSKYSSKPEDIEEIEDDTYDLVQTVTPSKPNKVEIKEEDEDEIYDEPKLKTPPKQTDKIKNVIISKHTLEKFDNNSQEIEEEEEEIYDEPKFQKTKLPPPPIIVNKQIEEDDFYDNVENIEEELIEYDESKPIQENNNEKESNKKKETKELCKPVISSPKPKIQIRQHKSSSFSRSKRSSEDSSNNKKIQNIIQQMEKSLSFKN